MKIGIISDIHNNLEALKKVIERFDKENVDKILCAGDLIGLGPNPNEVIEYLMKLSNFESVLGNHDRYLLEGLPSVFPNEERMEEEEYKHHLWEHRLLSEKSKEYLKSLPLLKTLIVGDYKVKLLHYCMDENNKYVNYTRSPSLQDLKKMYKKYLCDIIIFGHDHNRIIIKDKETIFINPGSLGCPSKDKNIARGIILEINETITIKEVDEIYDVNKVVNKMDEINYPSKEEIKKYFYGI